MNAPTSLELHNSSFSRTLPGLQLAIDSTSLGAFKECPRKYFYSIVMGYVPRSTSPHLTFGLLVHKAREIYDHARSRGEGHDDALDMALNHVLRATWDSTLGRPWFSGHPQKNRLTLIQTVVWYLDEIAQDDPCETLILGNGNPAIELSYHYDSGYISQTTGEMFLLCGHIDRIGRLGDAIFGCDIKTTTRTLSPEWFQQFSPNNQMTGYTLAGRVAFKQPLAGMLIDGIQVGVNFSRFYRSLVPRDESQLGEWLQGLGYWFAQLEVCALTGNKARVHEDGWPQNDRACDMYGGCPYRSICSKPQSAREQWLQADFMRRTWDPLKARGDI